MWIVYTLILLMLGFPIKGGIIQGFDQEDNQALAERLEQFFIRRCNKNAEPHHLEQVEEKLNVKRACLAVHESFINSDNEQEIKRDCLVWRDKVENCFDKFIELIRPCLEPEEKYIPEFAREGYRAYFNYLCDHANVFTVNELLESNMAKCVNRFMKYKETNPQNRCYSSAKISDSTLNSPITKTELCRDLNDVYTCYQRKFRDHCSDSPKAWEFEKGLLNAMRSPCNRYGKNDN